MLDSLRLVLLANRLRLTFSSLKPMLPLPEALSGMCPARGARHYDIVGVRPPGARLTPVCLGPSPHSTPGLGVSTQAAASFGFLALQLPVPLLLRSTQSNHLQDCVRFLAPISVCCGNNRSRRSIGLSACRFQHRQERCSFYPGNWVANAPARVHCGPATATPSFPAPQRQDEALRPSMHRTTPVPYP